MTSYCGAPDIPTGFVSGHAFPGTYRSPQRCVSAPFPSRQLIRLQPLQAAFSQIDMAEVAASPAGVYEPIMPQTESLLAMVLIVALSALACIVWANQVVPVSRTNLAISKSRGEVKEYLDDLKENQHSEALLNSTEVSLAGNENESGTPHQEQDNRAFERWLFTDWLEDNKSERRAGRQKEPALPILKNAKWNSGDNPVLAASALIGLGVLFTSVTERVTSFF